MQNRVANDPNSHVITHSQVFSYNNMNGRPEYYESSNSIRKAGDVRPNLFLVYLLCIGFLVLLLFTGKRSAQDRERLT